MRRGEQRAGWVCVCEGTIRPSSRGAGAFDCSITFVLWCWCKAPFHCIAAGKRKYVASLSLLLNTNNGRTSQTTTCVSSPWSAGGSPVAQWVNRYAPASSWERWHIHFSVASLSHCAS